MIDYLGKVREFHEKYGHYIGYRPHQPPARIIEERMRLIFEECGEIESEVYVSDIRGHVNTLIDLVQLADAVGDSLYVIFGLAVNFGLPIDEIFEEIHRSNMTKSTAKDEWGKTIKGPNFEPPDLKPFITGGV